MRHLPFCLPPKMLAGNWATGRAPVNSRHPGTMRALGADRVCRPDHSRSQARWLVGGDQVPYVKRKPGECPMT